MLGFYNNITPWFSEPPANPWRLKLNILESLPLLLCSVIGWGFRRSHSDKWFEVGRVRLNNQGSGHHTLFRVWGFGFIRQNSRYYLYIYVYIYICICICICVYIYRLYVVYYLCMCVHVHEYIYIYICSIDSKDRGTRACELVSGWHGLAVPWGTLPAGLRFRV